VPDLYAGEPVIVKARLNRKPGRRDELRISGRSMTGRWSADIRLDTKTQSAGVAALWARGRIADLEQLGRRGADPAETRAAIVETALRYRLVSRHTSLVAVDKTPARPAAESLDSQQVPNLLPHGQNMQAITGVAPTGTSASLHRSIGGLLLMFALLVALWGQRHVAFVAR